MIEYIIKLKRKTRNIFTDRWVWSMAWRDARHNFSRLLLFTASLVTGIAAVVALDSLNYTLQSDIDRNAKELIGADFVVNGDKKFSPELIKAFDTVGMQQASEADMASMVLFLNNNQSRLIRLVALSGPFPFYGQIETQPADAYKRMQTGGYAMLDETLASQFEVSSDDSLRLGNRVFKVAGIVKKIPGGGGIMTTFTPSVYIALSDLDSTGLVQYGSRVNYKQYFKATSEAQVSETEKTLGPIVKKYGHSYETVEGRKQGLGEGFMSIYRFFSLLGFVALILGCIGIASSVHIYAREKREEVAMLRCVGSSGWQAFNIYFIQIFVLGIAGSIIGSLIGIGIQQLIPVFLKGVIPFDVGFSLSLRSLFVGLLLGTVVSVLFSILPLVSVRFVPPLTVLRASSEASNKTRFSKTQFTVVVLIALFPIAFAAIQTKSIMTGLFFFLGLIAALGCLTLVASFLLYLVRKFFPSQAGFVLRHSLSSLFRPNNQTRVLLVTIGLGAFIISTLNIVEQSMLSQVEFTGQENQSNTILFDIQPGQREGVVKLMEDNKLKVNQVVPIITCRLSEVKGKAVGTMLNDTTDDIPNWSLSREYRVTYRDTLNKSEELIKGELQKKKEGKDSVWVTISEGMEENLKVTVGDSLVFDVQGIPVKARIAGIRKVDWPKDPPNFIFVFPTGVLENAPQIYVTATRIDDQQQANRFQQQLVMQYPNVSLIDLRLILSTVNQLFDKLGLVIRVLALFSIITGLVVLAGAVINSKFVRIKENVLLRTVGARTRQIMLITLIEYAWLGLFAALTGMILSMGGGWLLTKFFFEITFGFDWLELLVIASGVILLTVTIGWFNSREVINTPPLQILRKES
ncbi:ABC transporter permease [Ohtaekwangia koreensis]|uniref:Putative ABC transport system permease protein n=1 Tax=Ohtaekwangia koreensis TaxID=688867 RepID=A0A1T5JVS3_9BACT|nr:FtsX-like permease family protein [Ohtaekwangia koreensis]SKC55424.1 putative ABC transport system permease protein [Ohtaekwangia koreensis]